MQNGVSEGSGCYADCFGFVKFTLRAAGSREYEEVSCGADSGQVVGEVGDGGGGGEGGVAFLAANPRGSHLQTYRQ